MHRNSHIPELKSYHGSSYHPGHLLYLDTGCTGSSGTPHHTALAWERYGFLCDITDDAIA